MFYTSKEPLHFEKDKTILPFPVAVQFTVKSGNRLFSPES